MANIQDRGKGVDRRWQARYRDPAGRQRSKAFRRKLDAQRWLDEVTADVVTGRYVDPQAGRVTFERFVTRWLDSQTTDVSTREAVGSRVRVHLMPTFGPMELRNIRPSTVRQWLSGRAAEVAPSYAQVLLANLSAILGTAVEDGLIATNPCTSRSVRAPTVPERRVQPWTVPQVRAIAAAHPDRYRAVPMAAGGLGLRQGETFGLDLEAVDFLRRRVVVDQQVKLVRGRPVFAPPKGGRTREVPLPDVVAVALSEHIRAYPPVEVVLPWGDLDGPERSSRLLFLSRERRPLNRNYHNTGVWKPALEAVGIAPTREHGMHALRHHYASVMLAGGVSIRALADYLGHADPGFTLRIYAHLMPDDETRARSVMDSAHGPAVESGVNDGEAGS